jgi:hypothetical protein
MKAMNAFESERRLKCCKPSHFLMRLWSAVGERKKWSGGGETAGTKSERNAAAEPQTEAAASAALQYTSS